MDNNEYNETEYNEENFQTESDGIKSVNDSLMKWIIVGIVSVVVFILVFAVTYKIVNKNRTKVVTTNTEPTEVDYEVYDEGDEVTLKDGSTWHVLYESDKDTEFVSLLSDSDVNTNQILYGNLNSYLKGSYKMNLLDALECESNDIPEIRLLAYLDIASISGADSSKFIPEASLSDFNIPAFITSSDTVTDTIYETEKANNPVMICKASRKSAGSNEEGKTDRFCLGDPSLVLPVRPVLVISKNVINTTEGNE